MKALEIARRDRAREQLAENTAYFRTGLERLGFDLLPGEHPIIPIMLYDAGATSGLAEAALAEGVYVTAFSYPVVPKSKARIRTQMSAALTRDDLDFALEALALARRKIKASRP